MDIPLPTSSPQKKPTKPTLNVPIFRFCFVSAGSWIFRILLRYRLDIPFWTRQKTGFGYLPGRLYQVISDGTLWFGAASKARVSTRWEEAVWEGKGRMPWKDGPNIFGKRRRFQNFRIFHLWPQWNWKIFPEFFDIPFFVRCLFVF